VDEVGRDVIAKMRAECRPLLEQDRCPITREGNMLRLHTYAGGRVNATIAALVETRGVARALSIGDLEVDLEVPLGGTLSEQLVRSELLRLREVDESLTDTKMAALVTDKDRGRLAKFQQYLPQDLEGSYLAKEVFDFATTAKLARDSTFPIVRA
jgi:hypothetical protein